MLRQENAAAEKYWSHTGMTRLYVDVDEDEGGRKRFTGTCLRESPEATGVTLRRLA